MRNLLNHVAGLAITILLTLFLGVIGFVVGAGIWTLNFFLLQRAEDRQLMKDFMEAQK